MKKNFNIEIDCALCAQKCESAIKKIDGVNSCAINFISQKMILDIDETRSDAILKQILKTAKKIEPDFSMEI
ncbi:MAG: cation transporter [Christensenellales bacterium]